jgi:hypothetical protein
MTFYDKQFFSNEIVKKLTDCGLTAEGINGGLLLGRSHAEGGINVLERYADGYRLIANVEGQEYFMNAGAAKYFSKSLNEINNSERDKNLYSVQELAISGITTIDCFSDDPIFKSRFLLTDARGVHFIVNKYSTCRHLTEIEKMNSEISGKYLGLPLEWNENENSDIPSINKYILDLMTERKPKLSLLNRIIGLFR